MIAKAVMLLGRAEEVWILPLVRWRLPEAGDFTRAMPFKGLYRRSMEAMRISTEPWRAMGQLAAWIEPALVAEWIKPHAWLCCHARKAARLDGDGNGDILVTRTMGASADQASA